MCYSVQAWCWLQGDVHRTRQKEAGRIAQHPTRGYKDKQSEEEICVLQDSQHADVLITAAVDEMRLHDQMNNNSDKETQGDRLLAIKAGRGHILRTSAAAGAPHDTRG